MKEHKVKGNFVRKYFGDEKEHVIQWPETLKELGDIVRAGGIKVDGVEFMVTADAICGWAYRGFSLQHQGGSEVLTEEQKAERKEERKAKNELIKELLESLGEDELRRRVAEKRKS